MESKPTDQKPMTVREILISKYDLSTREAEVCELAVMTGKMYRELGEILFVTEKTIKFHMTAILFKCNVRRRDELMMKLMPILGGVERYARERAQQSAERVSEVNKPVADATLPTGVNMNSQTRQVPITPFGKEPDLTHVKTDVPEALRHPTFVVQQPVDPVEHFAARAEKIRAENHPNPNLKRALDHHGISDSSLHTAALCWTDEETKFIVMNTDLAVAFAKRLEALKSQMKAKFALWFCIGGAFSAAALWVAHR